MNREKQNKYRKTKIRAHLIDEQEFGESHVNILKFVEANESDDMDKQNSLNKEEGQVAQGGEQAKADEAKDNKKEKDDDKDNNGDIDMEKSEKSSNISGKFIFLLLKD